MCGHLDGSLEGLPEDWEDVPAEMMDGLEREVRMVVRLWRIGVIPTDDISGVLGAIVQLALVMGIRMGKLDAWMRVSSFVPLFPVLMFT